MRMGNKGQGGRGRQGNRRMNAQSSLCVCKNCGYTRAHVPGMPCRDILCPHCGTALAKMDAATQFLNNGRGSKGNLNAASRNGEADKSLKKESFASKQATTHNTQKKSEMPVVDSSKCTGCGTCVEACRRNAITLVGGFAQISPALCVNCGLCVRNCPEGALS